MLSSPVVVEGVVYVVSACNDIYAIDAVTGLAKWRQPYHVGAAVFSSPAVVADFAKRGSKNDRRARV